VGSANDLYTEYLRTAGERRAQLVQVRDQARQRAHVAREDAQRLLRWTIEARQRAGLIREETEARLVERRRKS
jgi:hypothetical protein